MRPDHVARCTCTWVHCESATIQISIICMHILCASNRLNPRDMSANCNFCMVELHITFDWLSLPYIVHTAHLIWLLTPMVYLLSWSISLFLSLSIDFSLIEANTIFSHSILWVWTQFCTSIRCVYNHHSLFLTICAKRCAASQHVSF